MQCGHFTQPVSTFPSARKADLRITARPKPSHFFPCKDRGRAGTVGTRPSPSTFIALPVAGAPIFIGLPVRSGAGRREAVAVSVPPLRRFRYNPLPHCLLGASLLVLHA